MYLSYKQIARDRREKDAELSFTFTLEAEKIHAELLTEARKAVQSGEDYQLEFGKYL